MIIDSDAVAESLLEPLALVSRSEALARHSAVPAVPGIYGWYFTEVPPGVPTQGCHSVDDAWLLYVGISPKAPPANGRAASRQNLRTRVRYHYRGNAEGSTLRLTLGCLLAARLGIELRRVGSRTRMTFGAGEQLLSAWMGEHAFVTWAVHTQPWRPEAELLRTLTPPLNLDHNRGSAFHPELSGLLRKMRDAARQLPIVG